jgi:hypothetical protein
MAEQTDLEQYNCVGKTFEERVDQIRWGPFGRQLHEAAAAVDGLPDRGSEIPLERVEECMSDPSLARSPPQRGEEDSTDSSDEHHAQLHTPDWIAPGYTWPQLDSHFEHGTESDEK